MLTVREACALINNPKEVDVAVNEKTNWSGAQTLITPKGRETFRLLFLGVA